MGPPRSGPTATPKAPSTSSPHRSTWTSCAPRSRCSRTSSSRQRWSLRRHERYSAPPTSSRCSPTRRRSASSRPTPSNRYVYTNARWTEITGVPSATAAGQVWDIDHRRRAARPHGRRVRGRARTGPSSRLASRRPSRGPRPGSCCCTRRRCSATTVRTTGWVGTLADITTEAGAEAAMAEARDQADKASSLKSDFLANMSHEIRTPMNGVIGLTELLLETDLNDHQREFAQTLSNSGQALLTVINGILDFSRIETGNLEVENIEFSVQTIVDDVVDLLAPSCAYQGARADGRSRPLRARRGERRPEPAAPGADQPRRQRDQVHAFRARSSSGSLLSERPGRHTRKPSCGSSSLTPASGSLRTSWP